MATDKFERSGDPSQTPAKMSRGTSRQLSLDLGLRPSLRPSNPPARPLALRRGDVNVFFAVIPDAATAERMASIGRAAREHHGLTGSLRPVNVLHVSLLGVGWASELPAEVFTLSARAGDRLRSAAFPVTFDRIATLSGTIKVPIALIGDKGRDDFRRLRASLDLAAKSVGLDLPMRSAFTPHVTLMWSREPVLEEMLDEPVTWTARELVLVRSRFGDTRHDPIGRWHLTEDELSHAREA